SVESGPTRGPAGHGRLNPTPLRDKYAPAEQEWRGQAQEFDRGTGKWRDAPRTPGQTIPEDDIPIGGVLRDPVEDDITGDPRMQEILPPEERPRYLDRKRAR
ncbi:MAG: hypothetical protein ACRD0Q_01250, partial [Acidimicrobiales bacterium]